MIEIYPNGDTRKLCGYVYERGDGSYFLTDMEGIDLPSDDYVLLRESGVDERRYHQEVIENIDHLRAEGREQIEIRTGLGQRVVAPRAGVIYALVTGDYLKIGKTTNMVKRMKRYLATNPSAELLGTFDSGDIDDDERKFLDAVRSISDKPIKKEWFFNDEHVRLFISEYIDSKRCRHA